MTMQTQPDIKSSLKKDYELLNFLSESSDSYFFIWDILEQRLYFSENIGEKYDLPKTAGSFCRLEDWKRLIYPQDLPGIENDLEKIFSGEITEHNLEYRIFDRQGNVVWINCRGKVQQDEQGRPEYMIGRVSDLLARWKTDSLTGAFHMEILKEDVEKNLQQNQDGYLLLVGVDNLKDINLQGGRECGDRTLKQVAASLEDASSGIHRVYRSNGDCFAVILPGADCRDVVRIFQDVQKRLQQRCTISGGAVPLREYSVPDGATIYQYAETSLDYAKKQGKNTLWFFSAEDYEKDLEALELKEEMKKSVENGFSGFSLHYQPLIHSQGYGIHGAEALLRYTSPRRGDVPTGEFIPVLEQTKFMGQVGLWVMDQALEQCRKWRNFFPDFCISVNITYDQLCQESITYKMLEILWKHDLPGNALTVEITESMQLLDYPYINDIFRQWKRHGIRISVDDFGTGYSSLGRLKEMDVDEIKIDRCFVSNIQQSAYNFRLLGNVIELAKGSGIRVCCEGVETQEELAVLEDLGPDLLQGFLFSRPCPPQQFEELYFRPESQAFQERIAWEEHFRRKIPQTETAPAPQWTEEEMIRTVLEAENDIFYISDPVTYELYYLNPAGQKLFAMRDYKGKPCYKVLQGKDEPCSFCTNSFLKKDGFYTWEQENAYCGRRFILKDKLVTCGGRQLRLEVALDVTKQEIVSRNVQERLKFAEKVVNYTSILSQNLEYEEALWQVLKAAGEFYQGDRVHYFEPDPQRPGSWKGVLEWCSNGILSNLEELRTVAPEVLERWMELFRKERSVMIFNLEKVRERNLKEWEVLSRLNISRIMAVPVWIHEEILGFVAVENPRYSIQDDSQAKVLANFLTIWIRKHQNEQRLRQLSESTYSHILDTIGVGLWIIRLSPSSQRYEMLADDTMLRVLGITDTLTPEECYQFWYSRINDGYYDYVNHSIESMARGDRAVQLEYTWKHPLYGEVLVRCTGIRVEDEEEGWTRLEGYHRIISHIDQPKFLPDTREKDVFEYNELNSSVFFHTNRSLLTGEEKRESDFPQCWIRKGIVHPHFVKEFQDLFFRVRRKGDIQIPEILLKGKSGTYEWFRLSLRHLGQEQQDLDTVVVSLEQTGQERVAELETMRMQRFYQALLSETIAYAEVDLESGQLKSLGGLWEIYRQDYRRTSSHFLDVLEKQLSLVLSPKDLELFQKYRNPREWREMSAKGEKSQRFRYLRPIGGQERWVEMVFHIFREEVTQNVFALIYLRDIHAEKEKQLAQEEAASRDPLTNNYNRIAFEREVCRYVSRAQGDPCGALMLLDVDDFKTINDRKGHLEGDKALKEVSRILLSAFRQKDIVGRLGGDEFLIFVKGFVKREILEQRLKELLVRLRESGILSLSSSIGVTYVRREKFQYEQALQQADIALYFSKKNGKNNFSFYDPSMRVLETDPPRKKEWTK